MDHNIPTTGQANPVMGAESGLQVSRLRENCAKHGIALFGMTHPMNGIVHVIGPELGLTRPGMTIVCGDSHTSTHGAFGTIAFGIGTSEVEMVMASQCLLQRRLGVAILHPDVNLSEISPVGRGEPGEKWRASSPPRADDLGLDTPRHTGSIRIGLGQVKGISQRAVASILRARTKRPFASVEDFYFRTQVNDSEAEALIRCGALGGFGRTRPQLLWEMRLLSSNVRRSFQGEMAAGLFAEAPEEKPDTPREIPDLPEYPVEKRIELEQEILGLAVTDHPLRISTREMGRRDVVPSNQLERNVGRRITIAGWLVTTRRAVTRDQQYMKFLTLEDRFGTVEVILFPDAYRRFGHLIRSYGPYLVRGKVELNHRSIGLTADWLALGN